MLARLANTKAHKANDLFHIFYAYLANLTAFHTASFINKKYSINQLLCNLFHCQFQPHIELQKSTVIYISFGHCYNL